MKLLATLVHAEGLDHPQKVLRREAVRGIILQGRRLLMLFSAKNGDYKFPGGGAQAGESAHETLIREVREECGAVIAVVGEVFGSIVELSAPLEREYDAFCMTSFYYFCSVLDAFGEQQLDPYEHEIGLRPVWVDIDEAIAANMAALTSRDHPAQPWTEREILALRAIKQHLIEDQQGGSAC